MSDSEIEVLVRRLADELEARTRTQAAAKNGTAGLVERLRVNLTTAIIIIGAVASASVVGISELNSVKHAISEAGKDKWRRSHQRLWAEQLKSANANLFVPDPEATVEMIRRFERDHGDQ